MAEHCGGRYWGEQVAAVYDDLTAEMFHSTVVEPVVDTLAGLATDGSALELGIGTGRIALPLVERGVRVHGIDASEAMVARLRAKPGADEIGITVGDFATSRVNETFSVVYVVFSTIFNLITQDEQVACFENAAAHLKAGGHFVIEATVPDLHHPPDRQLIPSRRSLNPLRVARAVRRRLLALTARSAPGEPPEMRYAWPSELDLMARIAGLSLQERWGGWSREPFTSLSRGHISIYHKP